MDTHHDRTLPSGWSRDHLCYPMGKFKSYFTQGQLKSWRAIQVDLFFPSVNLFVIEVAQCPYGGDVNKCNVDQIQCVYNKIHFTHQLKKMVNDIYSWLDPIL